MDRREKLLSGLDLARDRGIEIGPLDHPLIQKSQGDVRYVDYASAAFLRAKYADDANVVGANIPETDAIWGEKTLAEALGETGAFDYALASHVAEHIPDLIAWLDELHAVLKAGATLRLALPDRRYTFDFMRRESEVSDAITAHVLRARAPTPANLVDSCLNHHLVSPKEMWDGAAARQPRYSRAERLAHAVRCAKMVRDEGVYIDVHCWVFTPLSFALLMEQLAALGFVRYECVRLFDTERDEDEFIVVLRTATDQLRCTESWRATAEALQTDARGSELRILTDALRRATEAFEAGTRRHADEITRLEQRFDALERRAAPLVWTARRLLARIRR